jgi:glycosyltransferase involved in cell wall biosynthesis
MPGAVERLKARFEYLRALRYELGVLPRCDSIQCCTRENRQHLEDFVPEIAPRLEEGLRAGIDTSLYDYRLEGREPYTMLFLGSFRHGPNLVALEWFGRKVMPHLTAREPRARLIVAGSDPPPSHTYSGYTGNIEMLGFVEDIRPLLGRYAVFVCPILSGSGVRVKLLEAYSSGIPVVSTRVGAEGLAGKDGEFCWLADDPPEFAAKVLRVFENGDDAAAMAARARMEVVENWDMAKITERLERSYRAAVKRKLAASAG